MMSMGQAQSSGLSRLERDPDILAEKNDLSSSEAAPPPPTEDSTVGHHVRLNIVNQKHCASAGSRALLEAAGGLDFCRSFTERFYEKAFQDPHIDLFIRSHDDPHGDRFARWITEKMGLGTPWTEERRVRPACPFHAKGVGVIDVQDRSTAHFAAWHSPKRKSSDFGKHFGLDDCRLWMRLHFWAAREAGLFRNEFGDYYLRFIGHFVSVYERAAPQFVRESARWSADPTNIEKYLQSGRRCPEIMGLSLKKALKQLPADERESNTGWPYE
jgi:truncated hemoglobin YjbI